MDQYRVIITPVAGEEINAIHDWIAKDSSDTAAKVVSRILDALEPLKQFPHRTVLAVQPATFKYPIRTLPVRPYIIFFQGLDDEKRVHILHVRHGAQSPPADLK